MFHRSPFLAGVFFFSLACGCLGAEVSVADKTATRMKQSRVRLDRYSGRPDSASATKGDFRQLVFELQSQRQRKTSLSAAQPTAQSCPYDQVTEPRNNLGNRVPLSLVHWDRTIVSRPTKTQRWARAADGGAGPASTSNVPVFAVMPVRAMTYRGASVVLSISTNDWFEETAAAGHAITSLRVDAGDGRGWRPLRPDGTVAAAYSATGTQTVKAEATLVDGTVLSASAPLEVAALSTPNPTSTNRLSSAKMYLYKSGTHTGLRCPVLIVEGFDMDNTMDWDVLYNLLNKEQLIETLRTYGRDFGVIDFNDATVNIYSNAVNVMEAIRYINANRADSNDTFTVIGASMGGLVTRYALDKMESNNKLYGAPRVNTWISFDSPHEGANIPLGIQEFFNFFGGYADDYDDLEMALNYRKMVDKPAAQQMLLCHYKNTSTQAGRSPSYASFATEMSAYGYPKTCRKVAVCNGSDRGIKQPYAPGALVVYWKYDDYWTVDISSSVYALYKSTSISQYVYKGHFDPFDLFDEIDDSVSYSRYYPYALDNASGGMRSSFQELFDSLPSDMKSSTDYCKYANHCFIPTTSALGIPVKYIEQALTNNASVTALSPFDEFHCAATNEAHITINAVNKPWFMRAILSGHDTDGDGFDDYQEYVMGTQYDSADSHLTVQPALAPLALTNAVALTWQALPHVRYAVYYAETLDQPWSLVETVMPNTQTAVSRTYAADPEKKSGFYKMTATVVDPVGD